MNETERVVAMLEAGNAGFPSRAADLIRKLDAENQRLKKGFAILARHVDFASRCGFKMDPKIVNELIEEMKNG